MRAAILIALLAPAGPAEARQIPPLLAVPADIAAQHPDLTARHDALEQQREALHQQVESHNAHCTSVEEGSSADAACQSARAALAAAVDHHIAATNAFNARLCTIAEEQAAGIRARIEQIRKTAEQNQEELASWKQMNDEAQKAALWAAIDFAMASYSANADQAARTSEKLEGKATELARKYSNSRKEATRLKYLAQLRNAIVEAAPARWTSVSKQTVEAAADAREAWQAARYTMKNQFAVAAKHDQNLNALLQDRDFKAAFASDPGEEAGMEGLTLLWDQAVQDSLKALSTAQQYAELTGPAVRAGVFLREASYDAVESLFSTQRVIQDAAVAGKLAQAAGVLQKRYKSAIDDLHTCHSIK